MEQVEEEWRGVRVVRQIDNDDSGALVEPRAFQALSKVRERGNGSGRRDEVPQEPEELSAIKGQVVLLFHAVLLEREHGLPEQILQGNEH